MPYPQIDLNKPKDLSIQDGKVYDREIVAPDIKKNKLNTGLLLFPLITIPPDSVDISLGINGGLLIDYEFVNNFSISSGLCFSSHNAIDTAESFQFDSIITKRQIHYIIPVKFKYLLNIDLRFK